MNTQSTNICRGDIFFAKLTAAPGSHCQCGVRPVLVVSNDMCNKHSPVVTVVPFTSKLSKKSLPTHVLLSEVGLQGDSIALCEQVTTIDKACLHRCIASISANQALMSAVNNALLVQMGLVMPGEASAAA